MVNHAVKGIGNKHFKEGETDINQSFEVMVVDALEVARILKRKNSVNIDYELEQPDDKAFVLNMEDLG